MGQSGSHKNKSASTSLCSTASSNPNMSSGQREIPNEYQDYDPDDKETFTDENGKIAPESEKLLRDHINELLKKLSAGLEASLDWSDYSIYTGTTGVALLHFHLYNVLDRRKNDDNLQRAHYYLQNALDNLKHRKFSFLGGDSGPLAVGAVVYHHMDRQKDRRWCIKRLIVMGRDVIESRDMPDEVLYGRAGFLYALLFVRYHLGAEAIDIELVENVYKKILQSGQMFVRREGGCPCPLMYEWHDKKYLGAAHGLAGIFFILMQTEDPSFKTYLENLIQPSVDYLLSQQFASGNFPSSIGSMSGDKLVHWCHGAPGWMFMLIQAHKVFKDDRYLSAARKCADVIWKRGLLRKGYGLCHGVAGNAYALLALYRATKEEKYLHRAVKFTEFCLDYGKHGFRTPDRPYSLFEGMAGSIYFLVDMLDPENAMMPAFDLTSYPPSQLASSSSSSSQTSSSEDKQK